MRIKLTGVAKQYKKGIYALKPAELEIGEGMFGLIGRNGAGKTTLLRILATAQDASEGTVSYDGRTIPEDISAIRNEIGYLPQSTKLIPHMNVAEFLDYVCVLKGMKEKKRRREEIKRLLSLVGLEGEEKKKLSKYSGGMLRRAGIAQALIGDPKLLIVDEPTTGLDPEERNYFLNLLSRLAAGRTILFSTHITADIENLCEHICVLEKGEIKYQGQTEAFLDTVRNRVYSCEAEPEKEEQLRSTLCITRAAVQKGKLMLRYIADEPLLPGSVEEDAVLEDAYIAILGGIKR